MANLHVDGELRIDNAGEHLTISNIGSSGIDGILFDVERILEMHSTNPALGTQVIMQMNPQTADSFFDIVYDVTSDNRLRLCSINSPPETGLRMLLGNDQALDGVELSTGLGALRLVPNVSLGGDRLTVSNIGASGDDGISIDLGDDTGIVGLDALSTSPTGSLQLHPTRSAGHDHLTVSNIGASGQDGVELSIRETVPVEIVALSLVGEPSAGGPAFKVGIGDKGVEMLTPSDEIMILLRPSPGSTAPPHEFRYDTGGTPEIRETGPAHLQYENNDMVTRYEYDGLNRLVRHITQDDDPTSAIPDFISEFRINAGSGGLPTLTHSGNLHVSGTLSKALGAFKIDHPLDPFNKYLIHSFVESPDMLNIYNGNIITDKNGIGVVQLPTYFSALNKDFKYQLTVIGQFAQAIVKEKIINGAFIIETDKPHIEVSWQVTGVRNDAVAKANRLGVEVEKEEHAKGTLLFNPGQ